MADVSLARTANIFKAQKVSFSANFRKTHFLRFEDVAVLANKTSAIIQFRLTQLLCYISPEERAAIEAKKILSFVRNSVSVKITNAIAFEIASSTFHNTK